MTDDVAAIVLRNNYLQSLAISLGETRGLADLGFQTPADASRSKTPSCSTAPSSYCPPMPKSPNAGRSASR